ncbi:dihydrodipicolinate synthetase [Pseudopedobacter saltans DSM 12145]|uniref:Dihydrodipicolinate synthetase n=1 Tax=Pseudopedobacter saltans (strain ATCC 51119 / DSM 12145 / JCM 21818 / CCUG 39354 / LMG 10337 / NBRC 100064 / NCIMB 13643) TaxID=762903 RepID=F0S944_PSESL|nr:dihydrodipicolinate synthase family protein [Pseudopedobacter saltans]ADY51342.1 dihydrodipicolinate synthetase [Pseudopedobacter saltans DSM 12145]
MEKREKGFIPVMLTPFKDNGEVDYNGLIKLTELYIQAGAAGLFANCLSSEMFELCKDERLKVVDQVVQVANQANIPVVATGTFGGPIEQQADFVKEIYNTGVEAVIGITGLLAEETDNDAVFNDNVERLLSLTEQIPLGFYECPVPYKRLISAEQLGGLIKTGRVTYHKDTCLDIDQVRAKIAATKGYNFGLYDAYMVHAVESLKAGSAGLSCIQGNFYPELVVWLCKNYDNESIKEQVDLVQQFFTNNMDVMHNVYPTIAKYSLQRRGFDISTFTRRDGVGTFNSQIKQGIQDLDNRYAVLKDELELSFTLA